MKKKVLLTSALRHEVERCLMGIVCLVVLCALIGSPIFCGISIAHKISSLEMVLVIGVTATIALTLYHITVIALLYSIERGKQALLFMFYWLSLYPAPD